MEKYNEGEKRAAIADCDKPRTLSPVNGCRMMTAGELLRSRAEELRREATRLEGLSYAIPDGILHQEAAETLASLISRAIHR